MRERLKRDLTQDPGIQILAYPYGRSWQKITPTAIAAGWAGVQPEESASLYAHIPFCHRKCTYCDFLAYYGRPENEIERYLELLLKEICLVTPHAGKVNISSVLLGGGTPSLLSPVQTAQLLETIDKNFHLLPDVEISMEVFPDASVTREKLLGWRDAGIKRLSFGIQFFDDELKKTLNRTDWTVENQRVLRDATDVGFSNLSVDLLCGVPTQSRKSWMETVSEALRFASGQICIFPVSVRHSGVALFGRRSTLPPHDTTRQMYEEATSRLMEAGYHRSTRHNFVRPEHDYRYEPMIAELRPLVGVGANSIGYSNDCIYRNHSNLAQYAEAVSHGMLPVNVGHEFKNEEMPYNYAVRHIEHLHLDGADFEGHFKATLQSVFPTQIQLLEEFGLAKMVGKNLQLTNDGVYFTAAIKRTFFHPSAWERLEKMTPDEFIIDRGDLR